MNKEEITFDIPNVAIPREIKDICRKCEDNIHCQNKGCAFRSLGNEYCDVVLNATKLYLKLQQENKILKGVIETYEILLITQQKQIDDAKEWFKAKQMLTDIDDVCDTDYFWKIWGDSNE